jgi:hypothetical protein
MIAALRLLYEMLPSQGASPGCSVDTDADPLGGGQLSLEGLDSARNETILLASGASEQAVTFTDAVAIILIGSGPFSLRRATGETPFTNLRTFVVWADDTNDGVATTSVLLDGNGANQVTIQAIVVEKPTT